jgi:hypothetical protein
MECTEPLDADQVSDLKRATLPTDGSQPPNYPAVERVAHKGKLGPHTIAFYANQAEEPIILEIEDEITLGRRTGTSGLQPGLDLSAYGAYERGVSRVHACIRRTEAGLVVEDEGSSNGTWINGAPLAPHASKVLEPGDQFWLARLRLEVYFIPDIQPVSQGDAKKKLSNSSTRANFSEWIKNRSELDGRNGALNKARSE